MGVIRRTLISAPLLKLVTRLKLLPTISETERVAIDAGTVWVEGSLFSGKPDFKRIFAMDYPRLSKEEQKFLDGPCEQLCQMVKDWDVFQKRDLPPEVWQFIKEHKFFGMIIPKKYGGLEFSALGHSAVIAKLASRSSPLAISVMVPNSLGPAELLVHYGTAHQKDHYLPRLASGQEIPCFGLTEPEAGSDAGAIAADGIVFKSQTGDLFIKLNWKKRYITLGAASTIIGLAFKLKDPENLLGKGKHPGITCALIPAETHGVILGRRHDPLGVPFFNSPIEGRDVVVPVGAIIGGADKAGQGWRMLMECLAAGRGISLPATCTGGAKFTTRVVTAYSQVRRQFGMPLGKFEGVEEALARMIGFTYVLEAARVFTCGGLDEGAKPAVVTAMMKYHSTEMLRKIVNDGMDIMGGAGISRGPRNLLAHAYIGLPISITVEGANILTRTLIIFGQGLIRCHPYVLREVNAIQNGDAKEFDEAFWGHVWHVIRNFVRMLVLGLVRGGWGYRGKIAWSSARFAFWADLAMALYGGNLKRKEKISGRFADILAWMYLCTATLKRFKAEGSRGEDLPAFEWAMQYGLSEIQRSFEGLSQNMSWPFRILGLGIWLNPIARPPRDRQGSRLVRRVQNHGDLRDTLTAGMHIPSDPNEQLAALDDAFKASLLAQPLMKRLKAFKKTAENPLTEDETKIVAEAEKKRLAVIQVDDFSVEEYLTLR